MADPRLVIRVDGSAPQLSSFFSGVSREVDRFVGDIQKTYVNAFAKGDLLRGFAGTQTKLFDRIDTLPNGSQVVSKWGSALKTVGFEVDNLNNSLKATVQAGLQLGEQWIPVQTMQRQFGNAQRYVDALGKVTVAEDKLAATQAANQAKRDKLNAAYNPVAARVQSLAGVEKFRGYRYTKAMEDLAAAREFERATLGTTPNAYPGGTSRQSQAYARIHQDVINKTKAAQVAYAELLETQQKLGTAMADPIYTSYAQKLERIERGARRAEGAAGRSLLDARGNVLKEMQAPLDTLPIGYQQLPTGVQRMLQKGKYGLSTNPDTMVNQQKATFNTAYRDMERGLTHFSGEYETRLKGNIPAMQKWSATVDDMGKVVQTTGRNLRGFSRIFDQIGRDFQKVLEWTVATTLIFGSIQMLSRGLDVIKQLDADLTRFAVTANLSSAATKEFYNSLFAVAQATATPIEELVTAADDLALAVKRPGQSTKELTTDIRTLAEAIGVYTNLTGQDTVSATDQLVAVMKQLGYTAGEVFIVLNKVTAAAGGQSGSIADITKGLAVMAEAGKQAGLSVDQQIGVIKTLSQVTSKSPAEVATAFKNLVGALENPAAIKALTNLKIKTIAEGNDIIGIYEQISRKIKTGEIGATEVSGLLRSISGGPRRAPDAAALLANINTVLKETRVSAGATNEAFLANSQILDTLNAKFTIFQNTLKDKTFTQFGQVFKDIALGGIEAMTKLLEVFNFFNPAFYSLLAGMAGLALAVKVGMKLTAGFANGLRGMAEGFYFTAKATAAATTAQTAYNQSVASGNTLLNKWGQKIPGIATKPGKFDSLRAGAGSAALGAAVGVGAGLATGGGLPQIAGAGLSGAGLGLLMMPEPTGLTKAAGIIALVAGSLVSLIDTEDKAAQSSKELGVQIVGAFQQARGSAANISAVKDDLDVLKAQIDDLSSKGKLSTTDQTLLISLQEQYAAKTVEAARAQKELNDQLYELGKLLPQFKNQLQDINFLGSKDLEKVIDKYLQAIVDTQMPDGLTNGKIITPEFFGQGEGTAGRQRIPNIDVFNQAEADYFAQTRKTSVRGSDGSTTTTNVPLDLRNLKGKENELVDIIKQIEETGVASFKITSENLDLVSAAIAGVSNEAKRTKLSEVWDKFVVNNSAVAAIQSNLDLAAATIEALIGVDATLAGELENQREAVQDVITGAFQNLDPGTATSVAADYLDALNDAINTRTPLSADFIDKMAKDLAQYQAGIEWSTMSLELQEAAILGIKKAWGLAGDAADKAQKEYPQNEQIAKDFESFVASTQSKYAGETATATQDRKNKSIGAKEFDDIVTFANSASKAVEGLREEFMLLAEGDYAIDLSQPVEDLKGPLADFAEQIDNINGLQDVGNLTTLQMIERLFGLADAFNISGAAATDMKNAIEDLLKAQADLQAIKDKYVLYAELNVDQMIAAFETLNKKSWGIVNGQFTSYGGGAYDDVLRQLYSIKSRQSKAGETVRKSLTPRKSTYGGGSKNKGPGTDYGELDLPEELRGESQDEFIRQAIANARKLQAKIPGAAKEGKNDVVTILDGMEKLETVRGIREDLLRRALEDLAEVEKKRLEQELKVNQISRIRVGSGSFAAIANVPTSAMGISTAGPDGPVNVNLNVNGQILTPAQMTQLAELIAAHIKSGISKA